MKGIHEYEVDYYVQNVSKTTIFSSNTFGRYLGIDIIQPFCDPDVVNCALKIPVNLKIKADSEDKGEGKWILRKAFEDLLPRDIVWRKKEQFDEGSGTVDLLEEAVQSISTSIDFVTYATQYSNDHLRSVEECFYHKLLVNAFGSPQVILNNVGRWHL